MRKVLTHQQSISSLMNTCRKLAKEQYADDRRHVGRLDFIFMDRPGVGSSSWQHACTSLGSNEWTAHKGCCRLFRTGWRHCVSTSTVAGAADWLGLASVGCLSVPAAAKVCVVVTFDGTAACSGHSADAVDRHARRPGTNHTVAFPQNALVFFAFVRASSDEVLRFVFVFLLSCEALTWVFQLVFSLLEALARLGWRHLHIFPCLH